MVDLTQEMTELASRLEGPTPEAGRVVQFAAAHAGEGTSTVAREFAFAMSRTARRGVWLIELDLMAGAQRAAVAAEVARYGPLGAPVRASPGEAIFLGVAPPRIGEDGRAWPDVRYLAAYPVGGARWWVTRFRQEALEPGQTASVTAAPAYWNVMRAHADWVVVDAPAADRSRAALQVAPFADANVLVVAADPEDTSGAAELRDAIMAVGGTCAGMVVNRAVAALQPATSEAAPSLMQGLLQRARRTSKAG
jgi:hypothetical protein